MFQKAGDIISKRGFAGLKKQARAAWICYESQKIFEKIFKKQGIQIKIISWSGGKLFLAVESNYWAQEIKMKLPLINTILKEKFGQNVIKNIIIRVR